MPGCQHRTEIPPRGTSLHSFPSWQFVRIWLVLGLPPETSGYSSNISSFMSVSPDQSKSHFSLDMPKRSCAYHPLSSDFVREQSEKQSCAVLDTHLPSAGIMGSMTRPGMGSLLCCGNHFNRGNSIGHEEILQLVCEKYN
jgi:hypothetical protein